MSDVHISRVEHSDATLITAVRGGDTDAYGELFDRHREAATRLARQLVPAPDADDLVAESFIRVLTALQAGNGPDEAFRAYLLTSIRRLHIDRIRQQKRLRTTDDDAELDRAVEFVDPAEMKFEQHAAAKAYASLPERWQLVLWHLDVEGHKPGDIAPLLGMSANSVSALAYRAREGLRQAYLQGHLAPNLNSSCRATTGMLGAYVRKGLSARDVTKVEAHLDECSRCTGLYLELTEINSNLSGLLAPALLGAAATGYLAAGSGAVLAGVGTVAGAKALVGAAVETALAPVKTAVAGASAQGVVAAAVVVTVAAAGTIAVTTDFGGSTDDERQASSVRAGTAPTQPTPSASAPDETVDDPTEPEPTDPELTEPEPTGPEPTQPELAIPGPSGTTSLPKSVAPKARTRPKPALESTKAAPVTKPIVPTDYSIASVRATNELLPLLQRRFTIGIRAANPGRAKATRVTVTMAFRHRVVFRGVASPGWSCGAAAVNQSLRTLTCSKLLAAGEGTTFVARATGLLAPSGSVSVSAPGDPVPGNNSATFPGGLWPLT